jgi:hypothetical protein
MPCSRAIDVLNRAEDLERDDLLAVLAYAE